MNDRGRIQEFFSEYVRLVLLDIDREIKSARRGEPAGNFLCALALLAYTEVLGGIKRGTLGRREGRKNFDSFFKDLGPEYRLVERSLLSQYGEGAYGLLRCGLAHQGFFKPPGETVAMLGGDAKCGVVEVAASGKYTFVVERYFNDLKNAADSLRVKKLTQMRPTFPKELRQP